MSIKEKLLSITDSYQLLNIRFNRNEWLQIKDDQEIKNRFDEAKRLVQLDIDELLSIDDNIKFIETITEYAFNKDVMKIFSQNEELYNRINDITDALC